MMSKDEEHEVLDEVQVLLNMYKQQESFEILLRAKSLLNLLVSTKQTPQVSPLTSPLNTPRQSHEPTSDNNDTHKRHLNAFC